MRKTLIIFITLLSFLIYEFYGFIKLIPEDIDYKKINGAANIDAIIVLTGGENRIIDGLKLQKKYHIKKLFISGVDDNSSLTEILNSLNSEEEFSRTNIELGYSAKSTLGNRKEAEEWAKKNKIRTIILVTSNYHIPRSYLLFKTSKVIESIILYPSFGNKFKTENLFKDKYSSSLIISEFIKYLACKWSIFISDL
jgi:uncharacterized SAM-binding protein YcdF (DUF218 family)